MSWFVLALAILCEVGATLSLRMASAPGTGADPAKKPSRLWYLAVVAGYLASFALFSVVLRLGLGLGVTYGIWTAAGVALTALAGRVFFKEAFTRTMVGGTVLIIIGVFLIELGQAPT
ncbi:SMR family transporter [Gryllotalpicola daejeonensis]|uniref:SMR family transporter n=1 Tax=Gryllotalpicola daejeonensis TaxID=993087 RepID=A0ABP7ZLR3_9MICO